MDKATGYALTVKKVRGYEDARGWIYRLISDGIVKCGQCDCPATHVFWQDQSEFYIRCNEHREEGRQWTGSTRWNPTSFSISVLKDRAEAWLNQLAFDERKLFRLDGYDATDYYALLPDDMPYTRHYLVGSEDTTGYIVYVDVHLLTNGEYAYQITKGHQAPSGGRFHSYGFEGAWPSEAEALKAAQEKQTGGQNV